MKTNKALYQHLRNTGQFANPELLAILHEPDKNPTADDLEALKPPPALEQALQNARLAAGLPEIPGNNENLDIDDDNESVEFQINDEPVEIVSDSEVEAGTDLQHLERDATDSDNSDGISIDSLDSIRRNADFIAFEQVYCIIKSRYCSNLVERVLHSTIFYLNTCF